MGMTLAQSRLLDAVALARGADEVFAETLSKFDCPSLSEEHAARLAAGDKSVILENFALVRTKNFLRNMGKWK